MRIATWNVNSLKARLEKVIWWIERAKPDVLLLQETKLTDAAAPRKDFTKLGYELAHHGEGRWNGVAIASRTPLTDVSTDFDLPRAAPPPTPREPAPGTTGLLFPADSADGDAQPMNEARMISAVTGGIRFVSLYAPNGRSVGTQFFEAKLAWYAALAGWLERDRKPEESLVMGGDMNVAPSDADVWDKDACHGGTHVSPEERAAFARLERWGLLDAYRAKHPEGERYTWWDYRAGNFHKNYGMRIDHLLITAPLASRLVWSEIDREARKGKPIPSDHAPLLIDLDAPGEKIDAGWEGADERVLVRRKKK